jgi:hypothetical protein
VVIEYVLVSLFLCQVSLDTPPLIHRVCCQEVTNSRQNINTSSLCEVACCIFLYGFTAVAMCGCLAENVLVLGLA